jgi:tetratricopeptide (TPR) repeat protein
MFFREGTRLRAGRKLGSFVLALALWGVSLAGQAGLGKGRLTGFVKTEDGRPIASAKVVLRFLESEKLSSRGNVTRATSRESAVFETKTNKKGSWNYNGLAAGTWEITASAEGFHSASRECRIYQLQDNPRVELVLEELEKGTNTLAPGLLERADGLAILQKYDEAMALYRQYLEQDPEAVMVMLAIADCLMEKGDLEEAVKHYQIFVDKTSADPRDKALTARAMARMGECFLKQGDRLSAVKYWKASVVLSPIDAEVPFNLGEVLFAERNLEEAARYYRISAEISPGWGEPYYKLGLIYMSQEKYDLARKSFQKLIEIEPYSALTDKAKGILKELDRLKK